MNIGYARVSTIEQNLDLQIKALNNAGCEIIFSEQKSAINERPEYEKAIEYLRKGDSLVVWKLDRLGRNLKQLIDLVTELKERDINLISIQDGINTSTPYGNMLFVLCGAFSELELSLIKERTVAGLQAAKARGRLGGRPQLDEEKKKAIKTLYQNNVPIAEIVKTLNVGRSTVFKYCK